MTDIESKFRTRADAEAEIVAINEEIESLRDSVRDDIERLEDERAAIEEQLDDLPDEEEEKEEIGEFAEERKKHDDRLLWLDLEIPRLLREQRELRQRLGISDDEAD